MLRFFQRRIRLLCGLAVLCFCAALTLVWFAGGALCAPAKCTVARPAGFAGEDVTFTNAVQTPLRGWLIRGEATNGVVVLLHGVRANRLQLFERAQFLSRVGFSVLLFDFQAHGESGGNQITFGHLESLDALAAVAFARREFPQSKIGVIGFSLGGAAALLAEPPLVVEALVLESVFPTIRQAVQDRMCARMGCVGVPLAPLLLWQIHPRLGVFPDDLQPIEKVKSLKVPGLFIAGTADKLTTIEESRALFAAAAGAKEFWEVEGAAHVDLHRFNKPEYERRILKFFRQHLAN